MTTSTTIDPIAEITAAVNLRRQLATTARANLEAAVPVLIEALRHHSGQSAKVEILLWSVWTDGHLVNLSDCLAGLDACLAQAVVAMISARAYLGGDADDLIRRIIDESGSQPPTVPANPRVATPPPQPSPFNTPDPAAFAPVSPG